MLPLQVPRFDPWLDCKEIQPVHSEGDQPWDFFGRNDAKAETPVLWPPHAKNWLIGKNSDAGRDWGQEEKGTTEDEMAGWHHWLDGRESAWTPGVGDGQGGPACCDSWGRKESDTTERLNWTELGNFVGVAWLLIHIWLSATPWTAARWLLHPPPPPRVFSNSCPLSQWCYPTISFSAVSFSFCLPSFPASRERSCKLFSVVKNK